MSCKKKESFLVKDYLNYLAISSGIGSSESFAENLDALMTWNVVVEDDKKYLNDELTYDFIVKSISRLIYNETKSKKYLSEINLIEDNIKLSDKVDKETAFNIVDKAVKIINNKSFDLKYDYQLNENVKNISDDLKDGDLIFSSEDNAFKKVEISDDETIFKDCEDFSAIFSKLDIENSCELDFSNAEVISYYEDDLAYQNNNYNLISSSHSHAFNYDGFRISYSLGTNSIGCRVSKNIKGVNCFVDFDIKNVKTSFKYLSDEETIKDAYFKISMNTTEQLGISNGNYDKYYLTFKDLKGKTFLDKVKSLVSEDDEDVYIPICTVKTPIPNMPYLTIDLELILKFSISGKCEILLTNKHNAGFETRNGNVRFFYEHDDDIDFILQASAKACAGVNVGLDCAKFRLCDFELDGGFKGVLKSTIHLYDSENDISEESDVAYNILEEISKDNPDILVCADTSFYWVFDIIINSYRSQLYKFGLTKTFHILDDDDQVFKNKHHIENGQYVDECTRNKTKTTLKTTQIFSSNKITLNSYAEVLLANETFEIIITSLPDGYSDDDIKITNMNSEVIKIVDKTITAIKPGSAKIKVHTSDNKYNTYINILVSTG